MKAPVIAGCKLWIGNKRKRQAKKKVKWFTDSIKKVEQTINYGGITYTAYHRGYLSCVYLRAGVATYNWNRSYKLEDSWLWMMLST